MMKRLAGVVWVLAFGLTSTGLPAADASVEWFERRIRPVLIEHCYECHSATTKTKGGLRLDGRAELLRGGDSGPAVVAGQPGESLLMAAITHRDADLAMPSKKPKLPPAVIADFEQWIRAGAAWADDRPALGAPAAAGGSAKFDLAARKERLPWIWRTPERQAVPSVSGAQPATEVDHFIRAGLAASGLSPAPRTDDRTWLRRVHFAITGLPPTREQIQAWLANSSPHRHEQVVDALLASPHYGERWARHWMDLMRYAESRGHESDFHIANAWQYRNYLIRALNADLPYDQFVAEHLAGDLLPARLNPASGANESVLATGWAFLGEEVHSPVDIRQDECERVDNKVDVLSKAFLGLTVACARCHDHKFDAITQQDYYALSGFVLGSSFRQVRFETMEEHARAATDLEQLRERHRVTLAAAMAEALQPGVKSVADHLLAARQVLLGRSVGEVAGSSGLASNHLSGWVSELREAHQRPTHPLHELARVIGAREAEDSPRFAELLAAWPEPSRQLPASLRRVADFTEPGRSPWKVDGPGFGPRPRRVGELIFGTATNPAAPMLFEGVMPFGGAHRDAFWNRLTLPSGNESDAGSLEATARAGRMLRTPTITLQSGRLHYLIRGKARVFASVDSHIMLTGPLHGGLMAGFNSGADTAWVTHDLSAYAGHRMHLEFGPDGAAPLDVLMVVEGTDTPAHVPGAGWRPAGVAGTLRALALQLQMDLEETVRLLSSGGLVGNRRLAPLGDWLVRNRSRLGIDDSTLALAGAGLWREQETLAKSIRWESRTAVSWFDGTGVDEHVLIRGKPSRPGAAAPRALPAAFGLPPINAPETSGRLDLARQITDPANPLVARVIVNRVWQHLFGRGIVATPDNFGYLGERPTHPELLDHLAWQFVHQDRWSLKRLIKRLVLSDTFAQSSQGGDRRAAEIDPNNLLRHHMPVRRLEGEAIRDALLVVSGRFDPNPVDRPVPVHLDEFVVGRGRPDQSGPLDGQGRRSLYTAVRRNFLPTMMLVFDMPTPFSTVGRRNVTNVPGQALALMNDPFVHEQARVWASRLLGALPAAEDSARVAWLFETAYGRPPRGDETSSSTETLRELRRLHGDGQDGKVWADFCHALVNASEFIYLN